MGDQKGARPQAEQGQASLHYFSVATLHSDAEQAYDCCTSLEDAFIKESSTAPNAGKVTASRIALGALGPLLPTARLWGKSVCEKDELLRCK
jgi:hypothetical protein